MKSHYVNVSIPNINEHEFNRIVDILDADADPQFMDGELYLDGVEILPNDLTPESWASQVEADIRRSLNRDDIKVSIKSTCLG